MLRRFASRNVDGAYSHRVGNVRKTVEVRLDGGKPNWGVGGCWKRLKTSARAQTRTHTHTHSQVCSREPFNTNLPAPVWSVRAEPLQGLSNTASPLAPPKLNARLALLWNYFTLDSASTRRIVPNIFGIAPRFWTGLLDSKLFKKPFSKQFQFDPRSSSWSMQIWQKCPKSY